jgi:uncharacterized protein DUF541
MTSKNVRIALGLVAIATLSGLSVAAFASRSGAQPLSTGSAMVCPAAEGTRAMTGCGLPVWCCPTGPLGGITVTGQATMRGSSPQIRSEAIARAVADARQQAEAAAAAAGVKLGQVVAMQISSSGYPYAMEAGAIGADQAVPPSSVRSTLPATSAPSGVPCPAEGDCVSPAPIPVQTYVSVTMTWSLA